MNPPSGDDDAERLMQTIRARVAERRAAGEYPPDLESRLAAHYQRILHFRQEIDEDLTPLREALHRLSARRFVRPAAPTSSRVPGGEKLHELVARVVARHLDSILSELNDYASSLAEVLEQVAQHIGPNHQHPELIEQLDFLADQSLSRQPATRSHMWYDPLEWAEAFEGPYEEALRRSRDVLKMVAEELDRALGDPVLICQAGRGEAVEAARELAATTQGFEPDPWLVEVARSRGLNVEVGSAGLALHRQPDQSLGAVLVLRKAESLSWDERLALVAGASRALKPGGWLVVSASTPYSPEAVARQGYDPSWRAPVDPRWLSFACNKAGFSQVQTRSNGIGTPAQYVLTAQR